MAPDWVSLSFQPLAGAFGCRGLRGGLFVRSWFFYDFRTCRVGHLECAYLIPHISNFSSKFCNIDCLTLHFFFFFFSFFFFFFFFFYLTILLNVPRQDSLIRSILTGSGGHPHFYTHNLDIPEVYIRNHNLFVWISQSLT